MKLRREYCWAISLLASISLTILGIKKEWYFISNLGMVGVIVLVASLPLFLLYCLVEKEYKKE